MSLGSTYLTLAVDWRTAGDVHLSTWKRFTGVELYRRPSSRQVHTPRRLYLLTFNRHLYVHTYVCCPDSLFGQTWTVFSTHYVAQRVKWTFWYSSIWVRSVTLNLANKFSQCTFSVAEHYDLFRG